MASKFVVLVVKVIMVIIASLIGIFIISSLFRGSSQLQSLSSLMQIDDFPQSSSMALGGGVNAGQGGGSRKMSGISSKNRAYQDIHLDNVTLMEKPGAYLYAKLLRSHNSHVLPVNNTRSAVAVRLLMRLTQIVDIDEKSQIMTTNVWLRHEWYDSGLTWDPKFYGGIETINIPADEVWLPDTILYNNADGDYQITIQTKVQVRYDGQVVWEPPAIYKSFCAIDVEFFPYDTQLCEMKFGPWTEDVSKVDYFLVDPKDPFGNTSSYEELAVDMSGFYPSVEWDVLRISGARRIFKYPCCEEEYVDVTYHFYLRRKTLFYTINLIIPCVAISFLTVLVFYLPCESGEKVSLSISILISLTVFILLLSEIIPPTSLALPLMGKYLLFTMILVTLSIALTVLVLFNHFRHPYAYAMPLWVRYVFLDVLPKILMFHQNLSTFDNEKLKMPYGGEPDPPSGSSYRQNVNTSNDTESIPFLFNVSADSGSAPSPSANYSPRSSPHCTCSTPSTGNSGCSNPYHQLPHVQQRRAFFRNSKMSTKDFARMRYGAVLACQEEGRFIIDEALPAFDQYLCFPEVRDAMSCIQYISKRYHDGTVEAKMKSEWEAVSRVLDRLLLLIFSAACSMGTMAILLHAPSLYDTTPALIGQEEVVVQ